MVHPSHARLRERVFCPWCGRRVEDPSQHMRADGPCRDSRQQHQTTLAKMRRRWGLAV